MKLYGYALIRIGEKESDVKLRKIKFTQEVTDDNGVYNNAENRPFWSPWKDYLPSRYIENVFSKKDFLSSNLEYLVYLKEDNPKKAISLFEDYIQKEVDELKQKLKERQEKFSFVGDSSVSIDDVDSER